jgi:hypothetical protein
LYNACARGLTFTWFAFTLFWFWSDWKQIGAVAQVLEAPGILAVWLAIFAGATIVLSIWEALRNWFLSWKWDGAPVLSSRYVRTVLDTALVVISTAVLGLTNAPAPDIVYKTF